MRTLKEFILEASTDFCLNYVSDGRNYQQLCKSVNACKDILSKAKNVTYYDITKGDNSSEVCNLVEWSGEGGYWANKLENCDRSSEKETINKKKCNCCL